jgi:hypothetical protein
MPAVAGRAEASLRPGPALEGRHVRTGLLRARSLLAATLAALAVGSAAQTPEPPPEAASADEIKSRERMVLLGISTVLMAEKMYAAANGSYYGEIKCLTRPSDCIPGHDPNAATFLDPTYDWLDTRLGYVRKFYAGPTVPEDLIKRQRAAPASFASFAFTATPAKPGVTGRRAFCADSTGKICFSPDGREPPVRNGRCDPCKRLE